MQIYNPFLPLEEYIPDGEPHIFEGRVYIYGSHDKENGDKFCMLPYVTYSASVDDLKDWRYEGIIYTNENDPHVTDARKYMYAPDVVKGNDGRYYLYYSLEGYGKNYVNDGIISVAVSDSPCGRFEYLGDVRNPDGTPYKHFCMFDPAVLNDDGRIYLYYGAGNMEVMTKLPGFILNLVEKSMHGLSYKEMTSGIYANESYLGANVVELDEDMMTVKTQAKRIIPDCLEARLRYPEFVGHGFFEASSIRKFNGKYYFIYSSERSHDLVYAISDYPDRDFKYQGILVSNGDIGLKGRKATEKTRNIGNNHGSIELINGKYYIFYHRHTNRTFYSRQACAEEITMDENGRFQMVECTSCGLNGGPLAVDEQYSAAIACVLKGKSKSDDVISSDVRKGARNPYITYVDGNRLIADISDGACVGYKYFAFEGDTKIALVSKGNAKGKISVYTDEAKEHLLATMDVNLSDDGWEGVSGTFSLEGKSAIYISFEGKGKFAMKEICLHNV